MYPFSCVLWAIFLPVLRQIARYLPHHRSENASKTHPKSSHDKSKTASYFIGKFKRKVSVKEFPTIYIGTRSDIRGGRQTDGR